MLLARAGMKVLVIDRQAYGSDTMSTHALMRTGSPSAQAMGIAAGSNGCGNTGNSLDDVPLWGCNSALSIKPEHGVDSLSRRGGPCWIRILVDAARSAGADVRHGVSLSELNSASGGRVVGALLKDASGTRVAFARTS